VDEVQPFAHTTVLLDETVDAVLPRDGGRYIDCTLGGAGHSERLLEKSSPGGEVLAFDQDQSAIDHAKRRLAQYRNRVHFAHCNFRYIEQEATARGFAPADGILFDLGVSSPQFDEGERGFSYRFDAPLDMRMDVRQERTAADLVNHLSEQELAHIFFEYGEEKFSRAIARAIVRTRADGPIQTTGELAEIVKAAIPAAARRHGPHPARRVFQALRIAVNDELAALEEALHGAFRVLKSGGRLAVISFHSLEDRIVKQTFQEWAKGCTCPPDFPVCRCGNQPKARLVTKKPVLPSARELENNPRSRSAKLRVLEKL
jgi:16S rRNA (cytosine1402-N4)-methyltransferase